MSVGQPVIGIPLWKLGVCPKTQFFTCNIHKSLIGFISEKEA